MPRLLTHGRWTRTRPAQAGSRAAANAATRGMRQQIRLTGQADEIGHAATRGAVSLRQSPSP